MGWRQLDRILWKLNRAALAAIAGYGGLLVVAVLEGAPVWAFVAILVFGTFTVVVTIAVLNLAQA